MLYEYRCKTCGQDYEAYRPIARHAEGPICCGQMSQQVIRTAPHGFVDNMEEYFCPVTNVGVTSRRQRNEIMAREGLVDANDLIKPKHVRDKQEADAKALREKYIKEEPKEVRERVDKWARQELGL